MWGEGGLPAGYGDSAAGGAWGLVTMDGMGWMLGSRKRRSKRSATASSQLRLDT